MNWTYVSFILFVMGILGVVTAIRALMHTHSSQGAIAWVMALVTLPFISVPLYWILGQNRFHGRVRYRRGRDREFDDFVGSLRKKNKKYETTEEDFSSLQMGGLTPYPVLECNEVELLIDGPAIFEAIFLAIDNAQKHVVLEFYIVRDDELGRALASHLKAAAKRGCNVMLLYDEIGSSQLSRSYIDSLLEANIQVSAMNTTKGTGNRVQLNFRNHRKIVVVDGQVAFIGGANVGDDYVHKDPKLSPWRDTHVKISGPAALVAQFSFAEDWHWATDQKVDLQWDTAPPSNEHNRNICVLPTGPDDKYETCGLFFMDAINRANTRIWIASPYFVPDDGVVKVLQLAALRGVDTRIILPGLTDSQIAQKAAYSYVPELAKTGIKFYEFTPGFMHQKVMLIDDDMASVGTANFDNRSFRLNFEITAIVFDQEFASAVETMLKHDIAGSEVLDPEELASRSFWFHLSTRMARLFAPVL